MLSANLFCHLFEPLLGFRGRKQFVPLLVCIHFFEDYRRESFLLLFRQFRCLFKRLLK